MKKLLVLTFAMLFIGVGIASATDFSITGSYFARGTWVENWAGTNGPAEAKDSYGVYDHELSLDTTWKMTPYTKVFARFEIRDDDWAGATSETESMAGTSPDDTIYNQYLYGQHTFMNQTTLRVGLMGTSSWSTNFGNEGTEAYRIMVIQPTKIGQLILFTEKGERTAISTSESYEVDADNDTYFAGLVTKVNGVTLLPSVVYADVEQYNYELYKFDMGATGTFNNVSFESEFIFNSYEYELDTSDKNTWGAYLNVWSQLNALKIGGLIAHGSYDDDTDTGFEFGDDFVAGGAMILGDELFMHGNTALALRNDLQAVTLYALYASYAVNEKATVGAYFGYADSTVDEAVATDFDGANAWEANVTASYKITPLVTYDAGAAMAQLEYGDSGKADPDRAVEVFHRLSFNF